MQWYDFTLLENVFAALTNLVVLKTVSRSETFDFEAQACLQIKSHQTAGFEIQSASYSKSACIYGQEQVRCTTESY